MYLHISNHLIQCGDKEKGILRTLQENINVLDILPCIYTITETAKHQNILVHEYRKMLIIQY